VTGLVLTHIRASRLYLLAQTYCTFIHDKVTHFMLVIFSPALTQQLTLTTVGVNNSFNYKRTHYHVFRRFEKSYASI